MLINLSKSFCFNKNNNAYDVGYIFKNKEPESEARTAENIWLILTVSVNHADKRLYKIGKPASILYQSNDVIEKLIAAEVLSISEDASKNYPVA